MFDRMISPFFLLQYIFCLAYILSGYVELGILLVSMVMITTVVNYILLYFNYKKLKDIAERQIKVDVIR